jgi:hypothetical protein
MLPRALPSISARPSLHASGSVLVTQPLNVLLQCALLGLNYFSFDVYDILIPVAHNAFFGDSIRCGPPKPYREAH